MLKTFIERPVLSTVISIIIVVLGIIGLNMLPIEQYPNIAPPTVQVEATYSGASADVIINSVIVPLEEAINGVEGMSYMTSTAKTGTANITIYFRQGTDPDMATVNVQNLVSQASSLLPSEVIQTGVTVRKQQTSNILMLDLVSDNPDYDAKFLHNYANINIIPQIKRVYGVGNASVSGSREYSMRVWLKPDVMASYKVSTNEVINALRDQNIEAAPGQLGENSNQAFQYTLKYTGRLASVEEFEDIIIRSSEGKLLKLSDVADVELGSLMYNMHTYIDNKTCIMMSISQTAGSNANEVIRNVKAELDKAEKDFPPGLSITNIVDVSDFLNASISKVIRTLFEAFLLVFIVVFVFLQNFRSTLIPAIAVPVAVIGTFFFLWVMGFSINLLTLFALILAIGIVVDDAIVVVEAVNSELENGTKSPKEAAIKAMGEITPAIISITLVMASVFIPVSFMGGTSGIFYKQFGLTLAVAIVISAINALTLSPALCALFLKPHDEGQEKKSFLKRFYYFFNLGFSTVTSKYRSSLVFLGKKGHRWITVCIILIGSVIMFGLNTILPTGFVPQEDGGAVMGVITLPPGSSLERSDSVVQAAYQIAKDIPHVKTIGILSGTNLMSGAGSANAGLLIKLDHWNDRKIKANEVAA
ncbi:efflux RND transporter permease subunit, partial [Parabacteroides sp. OttesenSCG-928-J18]|nr:efflux RND transporter permease subunit [Parabacteroides sp. OttesenSCG-928-J18]